MIQSLEINNILPNFRQKHRKNCRIKGIYNFRKNYSSNTSMLLNTSLEKVKLF